jgi:hypothetical protein
LKRELQEQLRLLRQGSGLPVPAAFTITKAET